MNTKLLILLAAGLGLGAWSGLAQTKPSRPLILAQASPKADRPDASGAIPGAPADADIIQLLQFDEDLPLAKVIKDLARQANTNIQIDPAVIVTLPTNTVPPIRFENITPHNALKAVLNNNNLLLVGDPETKVGRVVKKPTEEPLITRVLQIKYANPTNLAEIVMKSFTKNKATAFPDFRTSRLVVSAVQKDLDEITNLVAQLDLPARQVLIEGQIMETSRNPTSIKGIDWSGTLSAQNISVGNGQASFSSTTTTPGAPVTTTQTLPSGRTVSDTTTTGSSTATTLSTVLSPVNNIVGITANTSSGFSPHTAFLNADGLRVALSFLNQDTETEVISTPQAVTLDNEKAVLSITRAFPIFQITPGTVQSPAGSQVTWTNLGTILTVTPRIAGNNNISMTIVPEVSNIDSKDQQVINGQVNSANIYAIRRIETHVVVPDGATLVMGGLVSDSTTKSYTKVPMLGDIPGLGLAFRHENKTRTKQNLLVFLTPTIVTDADYQPTKSEFLKNHPPDRPDKAESAWDSGKPKTWGKPKDE